MTRNAVHRTNGWKEPRGSSNPTSLFINNLGKMAQHRVQVNPMCPNAVEFTTSPGSLFQWLIILIMKSFPLVSNHNLIRIKFSLLPLIFSCGSL